MDLQEALQLLKKKGYKYTDKREYMLQLFSREKRYLSAKDVLEHMQQKYSGLSFDTIYRNLSLFSDLKILEFTELDGERKFRFSCATDDHHHHLICLDCGKTKHIHLCPMENWNVTTDGFHIVGHKFEVYGYCDLCHTADVR